MFEMKQKVLFRHCDPAGIVFFPRYFEMMNDCVEAFFDQLLDWPFEAMHQNSAVPTATITTDFTAPSRHGDILDIRLTLQKLGKTSLTYQMTAHCAGELRFRTSATLVHVNPQGRPSAWPSHVTEQISESGITIR